jgi:hypothetical protein
MQQNRISGSADALPAGVDVVGDSLLSGRRASARLRSLGPSIRLLPFAIAAVYLVVFSIQLPHNVVALSWNSDIASAFTLPEALARTGTGGHAVVGSIGAYVPLWFGMATASLPLHRELWEIAPTAVSLLTALAVGWSVSKLAPRRAAVLAVLLALVVTPPTLLVFMAAAAHNTVYVGTALLGAYLVWMARAQPRRRTTFIAVPLAAVLLGVCFSSDILLLVTGILPFACTAALAAVQPSRRVRMLALSAFTTIALALGVAWLTSKIMGSLGYAVAAPSNEVAPLSELGLHLEYLLVGLKALFGGYLGSPETSGAPQSALGAACDVVMALALATLALLGTRSIVRLVRSAWRRDRDASASRDLATELHIVYWTVSAASAIGAFVLSDRADAPHQQYYATVVLSVAAIAPLAMHRTALGRWVVSVGASIFFAAALVGLVSAGFTVSPFAHDESKIVRLARANHAITGYAGYWYASNLTWNSHERVEVRPVLICENPKGADFCPFPTNRVPSWYTPARRRTFLLATPGEVFLPGIPKGLGRPLATYAIDESTKTKMYIFAYDVASRLGPNPD